MSIEAEPKDDAFKLDELVVQPSAVSTGKASAKTSPKAPPRPRGELFARRTEWHDMRIDKARRTASSHFFNRLMRYSVTVFDYPFELPVEHMAKLTGLDRRAQLRIVCDLVEVGVIKVARKTSHDRPIISILRTTKTNRKTT